MTTRVLSRLGPAEPKPGWIDISRKGKWGNPFRIDGKMTRVGAVTKHAAWIREQTELMASLHELKGKDLVCACPQHLIDKGLCHGVVLAKLAEEV